MGKQKGADWFLRPFHLSSTFGYFAAGTSATAGMISRANISSGVIS
jgi:hypothetical protein